ncbi:pectin acetylesterase [Granulicella mallensis MP5ACTX8]|uniref:Pectin acetylesterase n=2 Tax=Granulicella mallensis TaxID=940614 RepID=G8NVQ3_GRAMM|nr:pectin acetylesterase [Granulicella mallensis MP5ACTX8]
MVNERSIPRQSLRKAVAVKTSMSAARPRVPKILLLALSWSILHGSSAAAQQSTIPLWPTSAPLSHGATAEDQPSIDVYLPSDNPTATGVLVIPGGGYHYLAAPEGKPVALWLQSHGIAAFVLHYRVDPYRYPAEMLDGLRAVRLVRSKAKEFGIADTKIGVWGFSAGGHLASYVMTQSQRTLLPPQDAIDSISARPDFGILAYPVISMRPGVTHHGSHESLLGPDATPDLETLLSNELHVTADTPPAFLFSTTDDGVVAVQNSVAFYQACIDHHVSAEMHLFEHGPHGVVLAQNLPGPDAWPSLLATWMTRHGWMKQ